jgi:hypothetical protein
MYAARCREDGHGQGLRQSFEHGRCLGREVHRWLVDEGHEAFLDQDLSHGILAGEE